jgi:4-hydroxybenzoate polyprenyltransferase
MNPLYTILESPHRWLILAGISFTAGFFGAIMMIAYTWPHAASRIWFYAGMIVALYFLARAFWDWKQRTEAAIRADTESVRERA